MTLYKVYYRDDDGMKLICYIEVGDSTPKKQVAEVREICQKQKGIRLDQIVRIVKDC